MKKPGTEFLHKKYRDLNTSDEVQDVIDFIQPDKPIPSTKPEERIQAYLDFLKGLVDHSKPEERERGLDAIKQSLYARHVIKSDEIPETYFQSIIQRHHEEGYGDIEIPENQRAELIEPVIADQKSSLDQWVDYLASPDAKYPDALKYWAFRSVLKMGRYDKDKKKFTERYGSTVSPFPELNQQALSLVFDAMEKKFVGQPPEFGYDISKETKRKFLDLLSKENFAKLYGLAIEEFKPISDELLTVTEGTWVKYPRGANPQPLVEALSAYGTGWCIRGESTARRYLQGEGGQGGNDLEVFYSMDAQSQPTVPRVVIVSSGDHISEVRGVGKYEELDPHIAKVVQAKLATLPDGKSYEKKAQDMKLLTELERKVSEPLTRDDLIFLYEIKAPIENFGYNPKDPRIAKLRQERNTEEDMLIIFECTRDEIARVPSQINENTKAYVGPICETRTNPETKEEEVLPEYVNIFHKLGNLEHVYTSFPEEQVHRENVEIGGKSAEQLISEMEVAGINITDPAKSMLKNREFVQGKNPEEATLIRLTVADLGFKSSATADPIYKRAQILGLELCPADTCPNYHLKYKNQSLDEWIYMGMKQITDSDGSPNVFCVDPSDYGLGLGSCTTPDGEWFPRAQFVFRLPSSTAVSANNSKKLGILKRLGF